MNLQKLMQRHTLAWYYGITTLWVCAFSALAYRFIPPELPDGLGSVPPVLMLLLTFGMPSVVALVVTAITQGKAGVKDLLSQFGVRRVNGVWYLAAAGIPALLAGLSLGLVNWIGGVGQGVREEMLAAGIGSGLFSALAEEIGWRGFAMPRLREKFKPLQVGLLVGLGWGLWHLALNFIGLRQHGALMFPIAFIAGPVLLTAFAVLMAWVYEHTRGSLLIMYLFHLSITASSLVFSLEAPTAGQALLNALVSAAVAWVAVGCACFSLRIAKTRAGTTKAAAQASILR